MVALTWLRGLLAHRRRPPRSTALGVAVGVALLASIGTFLSATTAQMTARAVGAVPVDWQVEAQPGARPRGRRSRRPAPPGVAARAAGALRAHRRPARPRSAARHSRPGPASVLGLPDGYAPTFPGELRTLAGRGTGVLLAQQTAANLHARPGDTSPSAGPAAASRSTVDGVVDLPSHDSLFQTVGAPAGAQPQAPPDNVVLLPQRTLRPRRDGAAPVGHADPRPPRRTRCPAARAPPTPRSSGGARNLETQLAGGGLVGDNLGTALDAARQDALYAQLLFLFLGVPGAILAGLLTAAIAAAGADRRRRDAALLRTRGASTRQLVAGAGRDGRWPAASASRRARRRARRRALAFGTASFGAGDAPRRCCGRGGAALAGLLIAAASIALPGLARRARR